ncbi:MAG: S8 family peptidase [Lachnospiraceae bacterium]|nr:S8 family peptidase [Lachnospiraceae bacterium]
MWRVKEQIKCTSEVQSKYSGKNISVAILDTGIFFHPDLSERVLEFRDFVKGEKLPYDDCGHGTHVAGCLAGSGLLSKGKYSGIAPSCNLIIGKILDKNGSGNVNNMLEAIGWILENKNTYNIRILNISIGFENNVDDLKINKLINALEELWENNILIVVAAGNKGPKVKSISPLGMGKNIFTVGCHDLDYYKDGVTLCESYSGRGPSIFSLKKPDLVAPGTNIMATSFRCKKSGNFYIHSYEMKSGTSFATPLVSGAAALLLEKNPKFSPEELKHRLCYTATDLKEPWNKQGWGMLNIQRALEI